MSEGSNDGLVYIYALCEPDDTRVIRYIGKTVAPSDRYRTSLNEVSTHPHLHKSRWIARLAKNELSPVMEILQTCSIHAWKDEERSWIKYGREIGWPLTNIVDGGEGISHAELPQSTRTALVRKMSDSLKVRWNALPEEEKQKTIAMLLSVRPVISTQERSAMARRASRRRSNRFPNVVRSGSLFRVRIRYCGRRQTFGRFNSELDAAKAAVSFFRANNLPFCETEFSEAL